MTDLTFITGNQNKADQLMQLLGISFTHHKLDLDEIQSLDVHEVVEHKVRQAYDVLQRPVLVEDVSLSFAALGRLPGPFIKWFVEELDHDGLVRLANSLPDQTATAQVCYGYYDGKTVSLFDGEMRGRIAKEIGEGPIGFGFDTVFINDGFSMTRAQMTEQEYIDTSYRTHALVKLRPFLTDRHK